MVGFQSPNHTQIPNDLFDEHLSKLGHAELKILLAILRHTLGFHKKKKRISLTSLQNMTGLARSSVQSGCNALVETGLVTKIRDGGVTQWVVNWLDDPPDVAVLDVPDTGTAGIHVPNTNTHYTESRSYSIPDNGTPSNKESIKENINNDSRSNDRARVQGTKNQKEFIKELSIHFEEVSRITWIQPSTNSEWAEANVKWMTPLKYIAKKVEWNLQKAKWAITASIQRADGKYTISSPKSIVCEVDALLGEKLRGISKPVHEMTDKEFDAYLRGEP